MNSLPRTSKQELTPVYFQLNMAVTIDNLDAMIAACAPSVAPSTMARIIRVESTNRIYAIGYKIRKNGTTYTLTKQPKTNEEAVSWARYLYQNGYQFDAGIAQVRSTNFTRFGLTPDNVFEPCRNMNAGGIILTEFYVKAIKQYGQGQTALLAALSAYGSGNYFSGLTNGYVEKLKSVPIY